MNLLPGFALTASAWGGVGFGALLLYTAVKLSGAGSWEIVLSIAAVGGVVGFTFGVAFTVAAAVWEKRLSPVGAPRLRVASWVMAGVITLVGLSVLEVTEFPEWVFTKFTGQMIEIDGRQTHVVSVGLERRDPDEPVVIFENGGSTGLSNWSPIALDVAKFAPVLMYDRPGLGRSPPDELLPTPERVVARLQALLRRLEVAPPYVLVGHSWGGLLIHKFAGAYPEQVVGLVYIDPFDFSYTHSDDRRILDSIAPGGVGIAFYERMMAELSAFDATAENDNKVIGQFMRLPLRDRELLPAPDVPSSVILAQSNPRAYWLPEGIGFDAQLYIDARWQDRVDRLGALAKHGGEFIVASTQHHFVHRADPDLVVRTIRRMASLTR